MDEYKRNARPRSVERKHRHERLSRGHADDDNLVLGVLLVRDYDGGQLRDRDRQPGRRLTAASPPPPTGPAPEIPASALSDQYTLADGGLDAEPMFLDASIRRYCRWAHGHVTLRSAFSLVRLWTYHEDVKFCFQGRSLLSVLRFRYADVASFPGNPWGFEGHIGNSCDSETCSELGGKITPQLVATQGNFRACVLYIALCKSYSPRIGITLLANGGSDRAMESLRRHKTLVIVGVILLAFLLYWLFFVILGSGSGGLEMK